MPKRGKIAPGDALKTASPGEVITGIKNKLLSPKTKTTLVGVLRAKVRAFIKNENNTAFNWNGSDKAYCKGKNTLLFRVRAAQSSHCSTSARFASSVTAMSNMLKKICKL